MAQPSRDAPWSLQPRGSSPYGTASRDLVLVAIAGVVLPTIAVADTTLPVIAVAHDGHVVSESVKTSSGLPAIDAAALAVVERAAPLPP